MGRSLGLDAPFVRPEALAGDGVPSVAVARHALIFAEHEEGCPYDLVVLLEPTAPLRTAADIDRAIEMLDEDPAADSVIGVCRVEAPHPMKMHIIEEGQLRPFMPQYWREGVTRQELPAVYHLNGAVYAVRAAVLREQHSLWGKRPLPLVMPPERSVNIDSLLDIAQVEALLRQ